MTTNDMPQANPGEFPLGSLKSRAAARSKAQSMRNTARSRGPTFSLKIQDDEHRAVRIARILTQDFTHMGNIRVYSNGNEVDMRRWAQEIEERANG